MLITFGQLLQIVGPFLGKAGTGDCDFKNPRTRLAAATLIQEFVQRSGAERKWVLFSKNNIVTLPRDLAIIVQAKIDDKPVTAHSQWYEFYDKATPGEFDDCNDWQRGLMQEQNTFATAYDISGCSGGYVLAEIGLRCAAAKGVYTIIQGVSADTGQEVFTTYQGNTIHGERLDLESNVAKRSRTRFRTISSITKSETDDFVKYYQQVEKTSVPTAIALLEPKETIAQFRRVRILDRRCRPEHCYKITVLGRVEVRADYHDNDIVPITDPGALKTIAQANQAADNNNFAAAGFKYQLTDRKIEDGAMYNRGSDPSLNISTDSSPGDIDVLI